MTTMLTVMILLWLSVVAFIIMAALNYDLQRKKEYVETFDVRRLSDARLKALAREIKKSKIIPVETKYKHLVAINKIDIDLV